LAQWWWRCSETARLGYREHRAEEPWSITLTTRWPRALLQCLFFTMIGRVVGGADGQAYTFVGSVAIIMPLFTMAMIADVPMRDRWNATFYRLRTARLPVPLIYLIRSWPAAAEAAVAALICIPIVGFVTGQFSLALELLGLFPIYVLMAFTSAAAGMAAASAALFGRAGNDIIVGNLGMYGLIAASGHSSRRGTRRGSTRSAPSCRCGTALRRSTITSPASRGSATSSPRSPWGPPGSSSRSRSTAHSPDASATPTMTRSHDGSTYRR
jgi:hypothetical protein